MGNARRWCRRPGRRPHHGAAGPPDARCPPAGAATGFAGRHPAGQAEVPGLPRVQPVPCRNLLPYHCPACGGADGNREWPDNHGRTPAIRFWRLSGLPVPLALGNRRNQPVRIPPAVGPARTVPDRPGDG
ncbi:primase-helicase zinc-binding domain-containing protein [Arthrobacter sp. MPF02]|uniref:primase-helicase zinc-binding domain-containing protein n=1 Tax=Arthrobacter sp. MPF02 TaxID=3388492 RepID=UPI00398491EE